jgi:hypothetical protein
MRRRSGLKGWERANLRALQEAQARVPEGAIVGQIVARYEIDARAEFNRRLEPYAEQVEVLEAVWRPPVSNKRTSLAIVALVLPMGHLLLYGLDKRFGALTVIVRPKQPTDPDWWSR